MDHQRGQFISKTHASNLILLFAVVVGTLIAGGAFCGWVCPFGATQDLLSAIRRRLKIPEIHVPEKLDRVLRYGRFVTLGLILFQTALTVKLWFADFDPYRTLFGLDWLFAFDWLASWPAYVGPLGGAISVLGRFSLLRIRRDGPSCKGCAVCEIPCPVKLHVATANVVSSNCIGCMACVDACPRHGSLELKLHPTWIDPILKIFKRGPALH